MRDDKWLFGKLDEIWDNYYSDVPQDNDVRIVWGRRARNRLGSIKQVRARPDEYPFGRGERCEVRGGQKISNLRPKTSNLHPQTVITINSLFKDEAIPEFIVTATIAHEIAHYAHGFHSPIEQKYAKPHAGGVVHREMDSRGLSEIRKKQDRWLKENWREYIENNFPPKKSIKRRFIIRWI